MEFDSKYLPIIEVESIFDEKLDLTGVEKFL